MNYRHLGKSGIQLSALSLGSWVTFGKQVDVKASVEMMAAAFDVGVNFFDNAEAYVAGQSEVIMGQALKQLAWPRGSYLVSTKLFWGLVEGVNTRNTLNRKYLLEATGASLKRFDLDYVDLLYCHRDDPGTPVGEVVWAMHNIIERGQALYWGTSEWEAPRIVEAISVGQTPEGVSMAPDGSHVAVILHNGSPRKKSHPAYNDHGLMHIFKVDGTKLTRVTTAKIGTWAQGSVWSRDGKTIVVQATHEKELQVFSFDGKEAKLTGAIKTSGGGVGMRTAMQ